jgi:hypothetical protein
MLDAGYWSERSGDPETSGILDTGCHPEGIFAVVVIAVASNCKDPYPNGILFRDRMTQWKNLCAFARDFYE